MQAQAAIISYLCSGVVGFGSIDTVRSLRSSEKHQPAKGTQ